MGRNKNEKKVRKEIFNYNDYVNILNLCYEASKKDKSIFKIKAEKELYNAGLCDTVLVNNFIAKFLDNYFSTSSNLKRPYWKYKLEKGI